MDSLPINDEEDISLSPETLAILNEFLAARSQSADGNGSFTEDWQLSQFWYTSDTCKQIVDESLASLGPSDNNLVRIACISCPSLIPHFLNTRHYNDGSLKMKLFEFDKRFQQSYPEVFVFYDYNNPLDIQLEYQHNFDYIIADPPFLSEACFVKIAQTIRFLAKVNGCKLLVCTGTVMEELLRRLLKLRKTTFKPKHTNNLANDFSSFANYEPKTF